MPSKSKRTTPLSARILRWIALIWSFLALADILLLLYGSDASQTIKDWPLFALWGLAVFGLLIAWKWALTGSIIALLSIALHDLLYLAIKGTWLPAFMTLWALIIPPAILFLVAWLMIKNNRTKKHK